LSNTSLRERPYWFLGYITDHGPAEADVDFTDERYWLKIAIVNAVAATEGDALPRWELTDLPDIEDDHERVIIAGISISEMPPKGATGSGSHGIPVNTPVLIFPYLVIRADGLLITEWCFVAGGGALGKGQYEFMVYQDVTQNQTGFDGTKAMQTL
jgi:hypothetical protein